MYLSLFSLAICLSIRPKKAKTSHSALNPKSQVAVATDVIGRVPYVLNFHSAQRGYDFAMGALLDSVGTWGLRIF